MKKKVLFLIPNLKHGGAEKVLVNLANNLSQEKYDITVQTLFDVGVHKDELKEHIHYIPGIKYCFRGNSVLVKILPNKGLWRYLVKEKYDIAISYLEGPTSRILGGCMEKETKRVAWVHIESNSMQQAAIGFRNKVEAETVYNSFDHIVAVSNNVKNTLQDYLKIKSPISVLYNTNETEQILEKSQIEVSNSDFVVDDIIKVCSVAKLTKTKGFERLLNAHHRLLGEGLKHHIYIMGVGEEQRSLEEQIHKLGIEDSVTLLGYQINPYQYVSRCDLYVCSSYREGFSTAVTEALIVGAPVVSTNCSGAMELLGANNEYGIVVENSEEGVYQGMKQMLSSEKLRLYYKEKAKERGKVFSKEKTVQAVEELLDSL